MLAKNLLKILSRMKAFLDDGVGHVGLLDDNDIAEQRRHVFLPIIHRSGDERQVAAGQLHSGFRSGVRQL